MSLPVFSHYQLRVLLRIVGGVFTGVLLILNALISVQTDAIKMQLGQDVDLHSDGSVWQGGQSLGYLSEDGDKSVLSLSAAKGTSGPSDSFFVRLPSDVETSAVTTEIRSIQDASGMWAGQVDPRTVEVSLPGVVDDSHTKVSISLPRGYLSLPWWIRFQHWVLKTPAWFLEAWAAVVFFLLWLTRKNPGQKGPTAGEARSEPPVGISVIDAAVLTKGTIHARDVAAMLFALADRGHLDIIVRRGDAYLARTAKSRDDLRLHEIYLLTMLLHDAYSPKPLKEVLEAFAVSVYSDAVGEMYREIYAGLFMRGIVGADLRFIHLWHKTAGIIIELGAVFLTTLAVMAAPYGNAIPSALLGLAMYYAGYVLYSSGDHIVPLTAEGKRLRGEIEAFWRYLSDGSLPRLTIAQSDRFYRYYAFAMVAGSEGLWRNRFTQDAFFLPDWFFADDLPTATPEAFVERARQVTDLISDHFESAKDPNVD